jgi:hypothetical protein
MIHASRRKILALFTAAPAALPVAIKEAAERAGISSIAAAPANEFADFAHAPTPHGAVTQQHLQWLRDRLTQTQGPNARFEREQRARNLAYRLSPNLAALRSVSPAVAYGIEYERQYKRLTHSDKRCLELELAECLTRKII